MARSSKIRVLTSRYAQLRAFSCYVHMIVCEPRLTKNPRCQHPILSWVTYPEPEEKRTPMIVRSDGNRRSADWHGKVGNVPQRHFSGRKSRTPGIITSPRSARLCILRSNCSAACCIHGSRTSSFMGVVYEVISLRVAVSEAIMLSMSSGFRQGIWF